MAQKLDSVSCGDNYKDAAAITNIYGCEGGYFAVVGNDAFIQVQFGARGSEQWSDEFHAPVGNGQLTAGTIGVRFRNYVAGSTAVVSAGLFYPRQPWFALSSGGNATPAVSVVVVTGIVDAAGGVTAGKGFTVVHSGTGVYAVTFTAGTFSAAPVVLPATTNSAETAQRAVLSTQPTASTFTVSTFNNAGAAADRAFNFVAYQVQ